MSQLLLVENHPIEDMLCSNLPEAISQFSWCAVQTERMNRIVGDMFSAFMYPSQMHQDLCLPVGNFPINIAYQDLVECSQFFLNYENHPEFCLAVCGLPGAHGTLPWAMLGRWPVSLMCL